MEPTSGGQGHSRSPALTLDQHHQDEQADPMSLLFLLSESPQSSPPPPPAENFGDGQISISPLDELLCIPAAAPAPLVATTHVTEAGQLLDDDLLLFCLSSEEVQQVMMSLQPNLLQHPPPMALEGLSSSNTTNGYGGPAVRSRDDDAVPPVVVQQHIQQLDLSLLDEEEVQIQQMTPTILPSQSQPPLPTPVINPVLPDEANHAAAKRTLIPAAPQDQEASTQRRAFKTRGLPSRLQDGSGKLLAMGIDMIQQLGRHIGKMMKDEEHRSKVWQHFWRSSPCKYCDTVTVICQNCNTTVMRNPSTIELLRHLESCDNNIHLLPAYSGASKATQRSSQALQIQEIAENPNGESEPIETDSSNCATNPVVLSPWQQQHELLIDREEQMATILSSQPCCQGCYPLCTGGVTYLPPDEPDSWWDLIIRLSDSSSTTKSDDDGFRLKFSNDHSKKAGCKLVHVHSSAAAWVHVSDEENRYGVLLRTGSDTIGSSYLSVGLGDYNWASARSLGCAYPWQFMHLVLRSLGFRKEFARDLVIYALGWVDACNSRLMSPSRRSSSSSNNKGRSRSIVGDEDVSSSGKRKRKPAAPRSKVWNHFTKKVVEAEEEEEGGGGGSKAAGTVVAKCNYCPSQMKAGSASHGTNQLARHIRSRHPEHAGSL